MKDTPRVARTAGRPQLQNTLWRAQRGLSPAQLEAAARVMRAHAERLAARREDGRSEHVGRPIEH